MSSTTFLTTLDRILKLLLELVKTELETCASHLGVLDADYAAPTSVSGNSKAMCTYCRKKGHTRRRCYHATRACFECGSPDHFVKDCSLKKTLSSMTEPLANLDSISEVCHSVASGVSGRQRNTSRSYNRTTVAQFNHGRTWAMPDYQYNNLKDEQLEAASVPINPSTNISSFSNPPMSDISHYGVSSSSINKSAFLYRNHDFMSMPSVSSCYYTRSNVARSRTVTSPAEGLSTDRPSVSAAGSMKGNVLLPSVRGSSSGEDAAEMSFPIASVTQSCATSIYNAASPALKAITSSASIVIPSSTAILSSSSAIIRSTVGFTPTVSSAVVTPISTRAITSVISPATTVCTAARSQTGGLDNGPMFFIPLGCGSNVKSFAHGESVEPAVSHPLEGGPYSRVITRISPPGKPIVTCTSVPLSAVPTVPLTSVSTGSSSVQHNKSEKYLRLYKTTKMACREYVAVEPMADRETLSQYASRFTGALNNAFPGVNMDTRRDFIDIFIEGLTRIYLMRMLNVKDEKCVKTSRKPFATFINRIRGEG